MQKHNVSWTPVAHACNPSYPGSRDQEDPCLKPAWANSSARPYAEKPFIKIGLVEWFKVKALRSAPVPQINKTKKSQHNVERGVNVLVDQ
jgi:hypothetical protein